MQEIVYESPLKLMWEQDWEFLSADDKAFCLNYVRQIEKGLTPSREAIFKMSDLYKKYPDINVLACVPTRAKKEDNISKVKACNVQRKTEIYE